MPFLLLLAFLCLSAPVLAEGFRCAGSQGAPATEAVLPAGMAAKPARTAQSRTTGTRRALVLFARFKGEPANSVPAWVGDIFNPDLPGSFSHFYDTMSFGKLQVRGEVASRVYESSKPASAYLSANPSEQGQFGAFNLEVLRQADQDLDFAQFDNDGPDGSPNSGDDDGVVDAVFVVLDRVPAGFLLAEATGIASLGFEGPFTAADTGAGGKVIQILPNQGTVQQGRSFAETAGSMCHEYGHMLGLPDLYNTRFLGLKDRRPEDDSAGVGAWCLMGWGATGWNGDDGPNSFCAWSRLQLGWAQVTEVAHPREEMRLSDIGSSGAVYKIPVSEGEYFLLEYRTRQSTYYDRHLPGEGLLIWHAATNKWLGLECADGKWLDAGYPLGQQPDPQKGENNLDFWAHDAAYTVQHKGNLGDSTDPFDGVRFQRFAPETNPSSHSLDGTRSVRIGGIRLNAGVAMAEIQTDPLRLTIEKPQLWDEHTNGILTFGEIAFLHFQLNNQGGLTAIGVRTVLSSSDSLVQVHYPETSFGTVEIDSRVQPLYGEKFPQVELEADPGSAREVPLALVVYVGQEQVAHANLNLQIASLFDTTGQLADLVILDDNLPNIAVYPRGVEFPLFPDEGPVFRGQLAAAFRADPQRSTDWTVRLVPGRPINAKGFEVLRFAFHPGDATGSKFNISLNGTNKQLKSVELAQSDIDLRARTWQIVEIPLRTDIGGDPIGLIGGINFGGNLTGTFYLDDMRLSTNMLLQPITAVLGDRTLLQPSTFFLSPNYPNPFNPTTILRFTLPQRGEAELSIYNLLGQKVATLVEGPQEAGSRTLVWNGRDYQGRELASGVYLYRLRARAQVQTRKLLLLR